VVCFASSSQFLRFAAQFGACRCHPRDQAINIRCLHEVAAIPPERQRLAVEPSRGVEIVQRSLIWFGQTEQAAAAMQQSCELARLTFDDQQPIVDGDVRRLALGQAECIGFRGDGRVPWMKRVRGRSPNTGNLPADHGVCLSLVSHTGNLHSSGDGRARVRRLSAGSRRMVNAQAE
jgi:hypothetical protein